MFISLFPSQMRRVLEGCVYKRAAFKRGSMVINPSGKTFGDVEEQTF